jgi:quercetin dioxygenase-like cupin family protein
VKKPSVIVPALAVLFVLFLFLFVQRGDDDASPPSVADGVTAVVRQVLAEASPDTAQGQLLELTRVIVPANQSIAPHNHPGPQLAIIESGTLTYTVIDGEATVTRAAATNSQEVVTYTSGDRFELHTGDSIMEPARMVHEAANETDEPVIIYLSSLFPEGEPPSTSVQ